MGDLNELTSSEENFANKKKTQIDTINLKKC